MNFTQPAEFANPPRELPDIDDLPPRNCPSCGSFLRREWNAEFDYDLDERGRQAQVVVYWQRCKRCNHTERRVV